MLGPIALGAFLLSFGPVVNGQAVLPNCIEENWLPEDMIYNPGQECQPYDGSRVPNCSAFVHQGNEQPYYHVHEYDCSKFWECGPAGETCLFHCAPCGDLCPEWNGLSFDCRYQYPLGPVCDYPDNVNCSNHIPCPACDTCAFDWQICDEGTNCVCSPECREDPDCADDQYCDPDGVCQLGCRSSEGCTATTCSECLDHQCVDPGCCADEDCPDGVCLNGECVSCIVDDDCNTNGGCATCVANECVVPSCCTDDDCPNGVCLDGECVPCIIDDDCNADGGCSTCESNECVAPECCADEDCPNGVCLDGICVDCIVDDDCNADGGCDSCISNECVAPECCSDDDCEVGQHCMNGVCEGECTISAHCPDGGSDALCDVPTYGECQYCDVSSHLCEQGCDADVNCPGDYPVCNPSHQCGCSDTGDCLGGGEVCDIETYSNCFYCDPDNSQCKPGCDSDSNCPADYPTCGPDHRCGCVDNDDCDGSDGICDIENDPYSTCTYCDSSNSQCKPGCIADSNCPLNHICDETHTCVLDGDCDENRPCEDEDNVLCDSQYSNCHYCDPNSKTCEPGCEEDSECMGFGSNYLCNHDHRCVGIGVSGLIEIIVITYTCEGCPASGSFETVEGGLKVTLESPNDISCTTNGLDNLDLRDYDNGITSHFDADHLAEGDGDDDGLGQCRGADLNLRLTGGTATWTGSGTWTGAHEIPICINFFGDYKPTCCCELEDRSLAQGMTTNLVECGCCATPPCL